MKKILTVLLVATLLFLVGCTKKDNEQPSADHTAGIAGVSEPKDGVVTISGVGPMANIEAPKGSEEFRAVAEKYAGVESVVIEEGVTTIGDNAFYAWEDLCEIEIPATVKSIGTHAFCNTEISNVVLPEGVTEIGYGAFSTCNKLTDIEIPASVEKIDVNAFRSCGALTNVSIPDGVTTLEAYVFGDCSNLETLYIGKGVETIDETAFINCDSLKEIRVSEENPHFVSVDGVLYTKDMKELVTYPFRRACSTYAVPAGVEVIRDNAFFGEFTTMEHTYGAETEVVRVLILPESIKSLKGTDFTQDGMEEIHIPASVTEVGTGTFVYTDAVLYGKAGSCVEEAAKEQGKTFVAE